MFDLTSSKLLILAIVALLVVGPKDFPILLRTIGRYMGILRKQANEFRTQFDDAMREAELDQMREQVEKMSRDIEKSVREADAKLASEFDEVGREADKALKVTNEQVERAAISAPDHVADHAPNASLPATRDDTGHGEHTVAQPAPHTGDTHDKAAANSAHSTPSHPDASTAYPAAPAHAPLPRPGSLAGGSATADTAAPSAAQPVLAGDKRSA